MRLAREKQIGSAAKVQTHRQHFDATFTAPASCIVIPAYRLRHNFLSRFFVPRCSAKKARAKRGQDYSDAATKSALLSDA
jgi:hypothetical protein